MYKFIDTNEQQAYNDRLPSEALILDGQAIEEQIKGYRTLSVSGRELMSQEINSVRRSGGDGSLELGHSYPSRVITIQYELKAEDNTDFRVSFSRLNEILSGSKHELRFVDEPDKYFIGTLSDVDEVSSGQNTVIGSFSFFCADGFKYSDADVFEGQIIEVVFNDTFDTLPDKIIVKLNSNTSTITIKHDGKQIRLTQGSFKSGQRVVFDLYEQEIYTDNDDYMDKLDLASEFEHFYLKSGVPIELVESGTMELYFEKVTL